MPDLSKEQCIEACTAALAALEANKAEIDAVKAEAEGQLAVLLTKLIPLVISKLGDTMLKYGFTADQPGIMQFIAATNAHQADPEVAKAKMTIMAALKP
mmetsp:Transcript_29518/g.77397  ORF Transcript_29518/g.77397 Transcript_29518/m.77397 type:complete len:99 (+) Transcript_29518:92-388(+)|eukprot:CAMPEP_0182926986 /NCGR_PEP_ID=MMETSP0105_2-20130417/12855_1 /TAXON_ID=81532 ORGANISM="Acanthoeca-like sp., Strain 10tr" /NCGR_SAMPLE_ID=MMETSP0105_2 /ASSEMBLY_ACC=CAM_ASM_000205 /LENGTH=98 /DNA_ID=CAMNT_0025064909 /DNA_START=36 /DNA_END=332 /DNA_ORIENTATION=-